MSDVDKLSPDELAELVLLAFDGKISEEQFKILESNIVHCQEARDLYFRLLTVSTGLSDYNNSGIFIQDAGSVADKGDKWQEIWEQLAEYEKTAPTVEIPKQQPQGGSSQNVIYPSRGKQKLGKFGVFTLVNVAAMIIFILVLNLVPSKNGVEVATITNRLDAELECLNISMDNQTRLMAGNSWLNLRKGYVELVFDNNTRVTLEGPSEFQILAEDRIGLKYGKAYAIVPSEAIGFSIYTNNAKIVDMGTEFGIEADTFGDTQLHVIKGKTMLLVGDKTTKSSVEVGQGAARKVSGNDQIVSDIPCDAGYFVRAFDSVSKVIWRQQPLLDLADMVRNGNGLGTGNSEIRLDPVKGFTTDWHMGVIPESNKYLALQEHPFVDGIFIPDGETTQIVTSRGDVFARCPDTSGLFDVDLFANPQPGILEADFREGTIRFYGKEYTDKSENTSIVMHANHGLTFDLEAMRKTYNRSIEQFRSRIGIADLNEPHPCNADFYVLVDGQIRYSLCQYKQKGVLNDVSVEIHDTDHFLTLVTTDGGDTDYRGEDFYKRAISCDWCIFTDPVLILK